MIEGVFMKFLEKEYSRNLQINKQRDPWRKGKMIFFADALLYLTRIDLDGCLGLV